MLGDRLLFESGERKEGWRRKILFRTALVDQKLCVCEREREKEV